ncbi:TIGR03915 family putative DNA repair protein [Caenimonas koreensis]|nr:TIGR03915 family putative DNA repair protein [Caenimonas koreensis]
MMQAWLDSETDIEGFREEARSLLASQVPPDEVQWLALARDDAEFTGTAPAGRPLGSSARSASSIVPASFQRLCEMVVLHQDPERFNLLYRLLWRLVHEPGLRNSAADPDMLHAQQMGHAVRRDLQKMKAFVHFRVVSDALQAPIEMGWFEPTHHIVEAAAPWFAQRNPRAQWAIFTPRRSVECKGQLLHFGAALPRTALPANDAPDAAWAAVYWQVFGKQ